MKNTPVGYARERCMNILFVLPGYEPAWALGGAMTATSSLARALVSAKHRVTVYTTNCDGRGGKLEIPIAQPVNRGGVQVFYYPSTLGIGRLFDSRRLTRALWHSIDEFDIVYVAATFQWLGLDALRIAQQKGVSSIMFTSGTFDKLHFQDKGIKKQIWYRLFLRKALDRCSALHLAGPYEREQSWKYVAQWRHFLVPHCIDLDNYHPDHSLANHYRKRYNIAETTPLLLAAGRIDPLKRLDILIKALHMLRDRHDFRLLIAGSTDTDLASEYRELANRLGLSSRIHWIGLVPFSEMPKFYGAGDLLVHLSVDENFGLVVTEAMACGLPVLVSPGVGVWKSLGGADVGECVQLDAGVVAKTLARFFENRDQWAERGQRGLAVVRRQFSPQQVAEDMTHAFWDIISGEFSSNCDWHIPPSA